MAVEILIDREWCKGCRICVALCPEDVLALDSEQKAVVLHPERCNLCRSCELHCPDLAVEVRGKRPQRVRVKRAADA
jgi:2-oxoglutarate ferredoxin oxidoreductase subunit delta